MKRTITMMPLGALVLALFRIDTSGRVEQLRQIAADVGREALKMPEPVKFGRRDHQNLFHGHQRHASLLAISIGTRSAVLASTDGANIHDPGADW